MKLETLKPLNRYLRIPAFVVTLLLYSNVSQGGSVTKVKLPEIIKLKLHETVNTKLQLRITFVSEEFEAVQPMAEGISTPGGRRNDYTIRVQTESESKEITLSHSWGGMLYHHSENVGPYLISYVDYKNDILTLSITKTAVKKVSQK